VVTVMAGVIVLVADVTGLGRAVTFIPWPVIEGFTLGIAAIIVLQQVPAAFGTTAPAGQRTAPAAWSAVVHADWASAWLTLAVVGFIAVLMMGLPRVHRAIPESLTAVVAATALVGAVAVSVLLAGCSPGTEVASTSSTQASPTVWAGDPGVTTLHQYIVDNKIAEVPFKKDEPGTPTIDFPFPPDWVSAGDRTPDWAYGAIVYSKPQDPNDQPFIYAIASKLTGDVDANKILDLASGQLDELPGFKSDGPPERGTFDGNDSVTYTGTYTWEGKPRAVGQQTIVVPGKDGLFVLQLNGEAPADQEQVVIDAATTIREKTKITVPS
jgi:hypothetical protein